MSKDIRKTVQFYAYSDKYQKRMIFSFKVVSIGDARAALIRMNQPSGYYVERNKHSGKVITNQFIKATK